MGMFDYFTVYSKKMPKEFKFPHPLWNWEKQDLQTKNLGNKMDTYHINCLGQLYLIRKFDKERWDYEETYQFKDFTGEIIFYNLDYEFSVKFKNGEMVGSIKLNKTFKKSVGKKILKMVSANQV